MTGRHRVRRILALGAALLAGGALALPFASQASTGSSSSSTTTGTTGTTGTTTTTTTKTTPPAPKPPRPGVWSGYGERLTTSSAVLHGKVSPHGEATAYYFQYGTTPAYGTQTPTRPAGSATGEVTVTQAIVELQPYTTYHFRIVAQSAGGTTVGRDATFTTHRIPLSLRSTVGPDPVTFGRPLRLSGTVSGTGAAGTPVEVQADAFPYDHGFHPITGPLAADAAGNFSFLIPGLTQTTELRVATLTKPVAYSPISIERVAVLVTLHVRPTRRRGMVRLYGTVTPSEPYAGVAFERRAGGRYVTVSGTRVHGGGSRFGRTIRLRHRGFYRALVLTAGGAQISGRSAPVLIR